MRTEIAGILAPAAANRETLRELHAVIQTAMGWQDYHLHLFEIDGVRCGDVEDLDGPLGDEETYTVCEAAATATEFSYDYDFGDGWSHEIRVEPAAGTSGPQLIDGARACPPEDCGGPWGYQDLLEVLAEPTHEEYHQLLEWLDGPFDPESFDLAETNAHLQLYDRHSRRRIGAR
ncbi:MAG: plasmid pRiA4b ORF-3 family protein [Jatrophihabitantaceae bacterium]